MADLLARDVLDYDDRLKMAALRILAESRKPVDVRGPGEIRIPVGAPPDNWLYNTLADPKLNAGLAQLGHNLVGSGTGSISGDILAGFLGGGAGIATEAAGGESGALDWLPGGGVLKGAVVAAPKAASILRRVVGSTAQDEAVDVIKNVAERIVNRLARSNAPVTPEDIRLAAIEETADLGEISGLNRIRLVAGDIAENTLNQAMQSIEAGVTPNLSVKMPDVIDVGYRALNDNSDKLARRSATTLNYQQSARAYYDNLGPEEKAAIDELARQAGERAVAKAIEEKSGANLNHIRSDAIYRTKMNEAGKLMTAEKAKQAPVKQLADVASAKEFGTEAERAAAKQAGIDAYHRTLDMALQEGMHQAEAEKLAQSARHRAINQYIRNSGGKLKEDRLAADKIRSQNARLAYDMLSDDLKNEISTAVEDVRKATREEYLKTGATASEATRAAGKRAQAKRTSETRRILHEMGFKSANDPRLQEFSTLNRNGKHLRKDGTLGGLEQPVQQPSPSSILGGALDITDNDRMMQAAYDAGISERPLMAADVAVPYESPAAQILSTTPARPARLEEEARELARMSGEDYSFIYDILTGRNNGDEEAMALYDMLMGK